MTWFWVVDVESDVVMRAVRWLVYHRATLLTDADVRKTVRQTRTASSTTWVSGLRASGFAGKAQPNSKVLGCSDGCVLIRILTRIVCVGHKRRYQTVIQGSGMSLP
jgi:hypothetical protein